MQRRLDSETGLNKPFENVSGQGRAHKLFLGGGTNFRHFFERSFFGEVYFKQLQCQKRL